MSQENRAVPAMGLSALCIPARMSGCDPVSHHKHSSHLPVEPQYPCGEVGWREDLSADAGVSNRGLQQHALSLRQTLSNRLPPQTAPLHHQHHRLPGVCDCALFSGTQSSAERAQKALNKRLVFVRGSDLFQYNIYYNLF